MRNPHFNYLARDLWSVYFEHFGKFWPSFYRTALHRAFLYQPSLAPHWGHKSLEHLLLEPILMSNCLQITFLFLEQHGLVCLLSSCPFYHNNELSISITTNLCMCHCKVSSFPELSQTSIYSDLGMFDGKQKTLVQTGKTSYHHISAVRVFFPLVISTSMLVYNFQYPCTYACRLAHACWSSMYPCHYLNKNLSLYIYTPISVGSQMGITVDLLKLTILSRLKANPLWDMAVNSNCVCKTHCIR